MPNLDQIEVTEATMLVTEQRITRYPLPTSTSKLLDLKIKNFTNEMSYFSTIISHVEEKNIMIGICYDWLLDKHLDAETLVRLDLELRHAGYRSVLIPMVTALGNHLTTWFDHCKIIRCVQIKEPRSGQVLSSDFFYYDNTKNISQTVINSSNFFSSQVFDHIKRLAHIMLSDEAADTYDLDYGSKNFGTNAYMDLEQIVLTDQVNKCKKRDRAIELGCGTGRHTFALAEKFKLVDGYDFSSKMIDVATAGKQRFEKDPGLESLTRSSSLRFHTRDIEMFPPDETDADLIAGLFGMGSFVEDLENLFGMCQQKLAPEGRVIFSFYNKNAAVYKEPPPWRHAALSAQLDNETDELLVRLSESISFRIYCKAWSLEEIRTKMDLYFEEVRCITLPKIAAIFPRDYPVNNSALSKGIMQIEMDSLYNTNLETGPYIIASGRKATSDIFSLYYLSESQIDNSEIESVFGLRRVVEFFASETADAVNVQPLLGHVNDRYSMSGGTPVVYIRDWSSKLKFSDTRDILSPISSSKEAFQFVKKQAVVQQYGGNQGDVPAAVFKPHVIVIFHSSLRNASTFRFRLGNLIYEIKGFENLDKLIGGRRYA